MNNNKPSDDPHFAAHEKKADAGLLKNMSDLRKQFENDKEFSRFIENLNHKLGDITFNGKRKISCGKSLLTPFALFIDILEGPYEAYYLNITRDDNKLVLDENENNPKE